MRAPALLACSALLVSSVAAVSSTGCAASQAARTRRHAELAIGASLIGVIAGSAGIGAFPDHKPVFIGVTIGFGALAVASAIVYGVAHSQVPDAPPPPPPLEPDPTRDQAWELTKQAQAAARAGDCATVATLDSQVKTVNADFHATVFLRDAAIARCLATPR